MTDEKKYNGWANRATWCYCLHLSNSIELDSLVTSWVKENKEEIIEYQPEVVGYNFMHELQDLMYLIHLEGEMSPWGITKEAKEKLRLWVALVVDVGGVEEMLLVNQTEVGNMLLEYNNSVNTE